MTRRFARFAGTAAIAVAVVGLLYSIVFFISVAVEDADWAETASEALLLIGGLFTVPVFVAVYERLRAEDHGFALLALVLGTAGAVGTAIHGAYDLARIVTRQGAEELFPNPVDPRGFLAFCVAGLALIVLGWLARDAAGFPSRIAPLAMVAGVLLVVLYVARLTIEDVENPLIVVVAALVGFVVNPALYIWLGLILRRAADGGDERAIDPGRAAT